MRETAAPAPVDPVPDAVPDPAAGWDNGQHLRRFAAVFLLSVLVLTGMFGAYQYALFAIDRELVETRELARLQVSALVARRHLTSVVTDLRVLAESENLARFLNQRNSRASWAYLAKEFVVHAREMGVYDRISYVDTDGAELVAITTDRNGEAAILPRSDLTDRSQCDCFLHAIELGRGEVYLSPIDLNRSQDTSPQRIEPTINLGMPAVDGRGRKRGVLIITFRAQDMLDELAQALDAGGGDWAVLDPKGHWLLGPAEQALWGNHVDRWQPFSESHPRVWTAIAETGTGRLETGGAAYLFHTTFPLADVVPALRVTEKANRPWIILSRFSPAQIAAAFNRSMAADLSLFAVLVALAAFASWHFSKAWVLRQSAGVALRRLHQAVEQSPVSVTITDPTGIVVYANPAVEARSNRPRSELEGRSAKHLIPGREAVADGVGSPWSALLAGREWRGMTHRRRETGEETWESVLISPIRGADGTVTHVLSIQENKTEHMEVIEALRESEEKYRRLVENAGDAIIIVDLRSGSIIEANQLAADLFGTDGRPLVGRAYAEWWSGTVPEWLDAILHSGAPQHRSAELDLAGGRHVFLEVHSVPAFINEQRIVQVVFRDVTESKQGEQRLRQAQKMEAIGTMAGGIAHDFNNILTAITGYATLLYEDLADGMPQKEDAGRILKAVDRTRAIVRQILTFSRSGSLDRQWVSVPSLIAEVMDLLRATIPATIEINQNIDTAVGWVLEDPSEIHQMVMNLCLNAADAIGTEKGLIDVSLVNRRPEPGDGNLPPHLIGDSCLWLRVRDTGCGMDPAIIERIFDPFFTTKGVGQGTGMGLAVVHGIVSRLDGTIQVSSEPGRGTTFEIVFPITEEVPDLKLPASFDTPTGNERILLVDDEREVAETLARGLARLGYEVETVGGGEAALSMVRKSPTGFAVLVTDQTMPRMTGLDLAAEITFVAPDLPVILCSGTLLSAPEDQASINGVRAFMQKPFSAERLAVKIREILDAQHRAGSLRAGNIR